jgi:hypothetical protein
MRALQFLVLRWIISVDDRKQHIPQPATCMGLWLRHGCQGRIGMNAKFQAIITND